MELYYGNIVTQPSYNNHSKGKVCPYCGQSSQTIFVHGHEQCVVCKTNVEPCCQGEVQESDWTGNYNRQINYKKYSLNKYKTNNAKVKEIKYL